CQGLKGFLESKRLSTTVGDEGGFAPNLPSNEAALQLVLEAIERAGYHAGTNVALALDCASSEFYRDGKYLLDSKKQKLGSSEFGEFLARWADKYPIISIEDAMAESDRNLPSNEAALQLVLEAIERAGYHAGTNVALALDCASSEFYRDGKYLLDSKKQKLGSSEFGEFLARWADKYPIISIEDGMAESDWDGWRALTDRLGKKVQLVGDDVFVTNTKILREGIQLGVANSILIKVNQ